MRVGTLRAHSCSGIPSMTARPFGNPCIHWLSIGLGRHQMEQKKQNTFSHVLFHLVSFFHFVGCSVDWSVKEMYQNVVETLSPLGQIWRGRAGNSHVTDVNSNSFFHFPKDEFSKTSTKICLLLGRFPNDVTKYLSLITYHPFLKRAGASVVFIPGIVASGIVLNSKNNYHFLFMSLGASIYSLDIRCKFVFAF